MKEYYGKVIPKFVLGTQSAETCEVAGERQLAVMVAMEINDPDISTHSFHRSLVSVDCKLGTGFRYLHQYNFLKFYV